MTHLIDASSVSKTYHLKVGGDGFLQMVKHLISPHWSDHPVLRDISLHLEKGECLGFLGPNGAGKSTLIKILCGVQRPDEGTLTVLGQNPYRGSRAFFRRITVVFGHKSSLWWDLPLRTSFEMARVIYRIKDKTYANNVQELCRALDLTPLLDRPVRVLSLGERVKGEIAMSLLCDPEILFLDEPTIGLDITSKAEIRELLRQRRLQRNLGVFITSHDMGDIDGYCDRILLLHKGEIRFSGSMAQLKDKIQNERMITVRFADGEGINVAHIFKELGVLTVRADASEIVLSCARGRDLDVVRRVLSDFPSVTELSVGNPSLEESLRKEFLSYRVESSQ